MYRLNGKSITIYSRICYVDKTCTDLNVTFGDVCKESLSISQFIRLRKFAYFALTYNDMVNLTYATDTKEHLKSNQLQFSISRHLHACTAIISNCYITKSNNVIIFYQNEESIFRR